jgi:hypothetical protein
MQLQYFMAEVVYIPAKVNELKFVIAVSSELVGDTCEELAMAVLIVKVKIVVEVKVVW